jgi:outer membrane protein TolC
MRAPTLMFVALLAVGCTRAHYRRSADRETYQIMADRDSLEPGYSIGRLRLEPAPGSRLADPYDPDHPPKPPDDAASALLMSHPYKFRGYRRWGRYGYTNLIEGPDWEQALPLDTNGVLKLDSRTAAEIALANSRDYQTNLETVYESALSLTLNRFEFDLHWLGTNNTTYTRVGTGSAPGETNTLTSITTAGFTRNLAAGGQITAEFINNLVYQYTGGGGGVFGSNIFLGLTQPLIRGFGRDVALEPLTQAERDVLYAIRTFARFRKSFYVGVTAGGNTGVGYLGLLLLVQQLRNAESILKQQEESYRLYDELFRGGRASVVDVDVIYQGLLSSRLQVVNSQLALDNALDAYKIQLGLPPRLPVELDDGPLRLFVLTDPAADKLRDEVEAFQRARLAELDAPPSVAVLNKAFTDILQLANRVPGVVKSATIDLDAFRVLLSNPSRTDDPEQRTRDRTTLQALTVAMADADEELKKLVTRIETDAKTVAEDKRKDNWVAVTQAAKRLLAVLDTVIAVQTQARIYTIELPEAGGEEGPLLAYAKANRLDLQNQLGQATDAWRKVTVAANALQGDLNFNGSVNLATDPTRQTPLKFDAHANTYTAGVQIDTPLNRQAERNAYRLSLITYQQAKRAVVALSDQIEQQIRLDLRQLRQLRASFGIARQQLLAAARQYENTRLSLVGPQDGQQQRGGGTDTATLQLQTALTNLLSARNALAAAYINFEQQRLQLLLDLEELQLDQRGFPTNADPRSSGFNYPGTGRDGQPGGPANPPVGRVP